MIPFATSAAPAGSDLSILAGGADTPAYLIHPADSHRELHAYRRLRQAEFVAEQGLFASSDADSVDDDPRTIVLVASAPDGRVLGGVRLAPATDLDIGWWTGSRLVTEPAARCLGVGPALINAACAYAESAGVLRFEATVQCRYEKLFIRLGWERVDDRTVGGTPHVGMRWPVGTLARLASTTKGFLGTALTPLRNVPGGLGAAGFVGDDGAPVPGSDIIAACDAIIPSMVERDPEWAGWCSVLVNVNDLTAMGAAPTGLLDAIGAPTRALLDRIIDGLAAASAAWGVPVLGGHTQLGVPAALAVTALGRTTSPLRGGGGKAGDRVRLTADTNGQWRPGYRGRQWDSTSCRTRDDLVAMTRIPAAMGPVAAKDVSMAGVVGTLGMLAEACGTGAELDISAVPKPRDAAMSDWLTCFPGYGMLTVGGTACEQELPPGVRTAHCGTLVSEPGVWLRWPDGVATCALTSPVTGLGQA